MRFLTSHDHDLVLTSGSRGGEVTGELQRQPVSHRHQPYREEDTRQEPCLGVREVPRVPHLCPHQLPSTAWPV